MHCPPVSSKSGRRNTKREAHNVRERLEMAFHVPFQMLVGGKPGTAFFHFTAFISFHRFGSFALESKRSPIPLSPRWNQEAAPIWLFFAVHCLDVRLEMRISKERLIAVLRILGAFVRTAAGVRSDVLFEAAWSGKGFVAVLIGTGEL